MNTGIKKVQESTTTVVDTLDTLKTERVTPELLKVDASYKESGSRYSNIVNPIVFATKTTVYTKPNISSPIIRYLNFLSPIKIINEHDDYYVTERNETDPTTGKNMHHTVHHTRGWYKIVIDDLIGYVLKEDISSHTFYNPDKTKLYIFTSERSKEYNKNLKFKVFKYNLTERRITDSLVTDFQRTDLIERINSDGWKNTQFLARASEITASCGGGRIDLFIIDANDKLSLLTSRNDWYSDGDGDSDVSEVWLPIKSNGVVRLLQNGGLSFFGDETNIEYKNYNINLLDSLKIPLSELVIKTEYETKGINDKNGEPLYNKDSTYKAEVVKNNILYYRWDGSKLSKEFIQQIE